MLTDKQLAEIKAELGDFSQWKKLGERLGLSPGSIEIIKADCSDTDERLGQVLLKWLRRTHNERDYGSPTWGNLVKALNPINPALAEEIQKKHCTHQGTTTAGLTQEKPQVKSRTMSKSQENIPPRQAGQVKPTETVSGPTRNFDQRVLYYIGIPVAVFAIAIGARLLTVFPWPIPSVWSPALPCKWPGPNSDEVQLQTRPVITALSVKEMSDNLKTLKVQVGKAVIAGDHCNDSVLLDKMKMVDSTAEKIKERVRGTFESFSVGAATSLTKLKSAWDSAVDGEAARALQQVEDICQTAETLAKEVDALKGYMRTQAGGMHQAVKALVSYQEPVKINHERRLQKLKQERQDYLEQKIASESAVKKASTLAREAEINARKESEAWENLKSKRGAGLTDILDDVFGIEDHKPFEERRENFLKDQRDYEAKAQEEERKVNQNRVLISKVEGTIETENFLFTCIVDAIREMKEAVGVVDMITFSDSLFEQDLKKDCKDLSNMMKLIDHGWFTTTKDSTLSQVCDKAVKVFAKWQALFIISSEYVTNGDL